jgi:group I intron endonuclease
MIYLYSIKNEVNGKLYIGQTVNPARRWADHQSSARTRHDGCPKLHRAMRSYGIENFSFFVEWKCKTQDEADRLERILISLNDTVENGYNLNLGGNGVGNHSEETKRKISESNKGRPGRKGIARPKEVVQRMVSTRKRNGYRHSEDTKRKISAARKGQTHSVPFLKPWNDYSREQALKSVVKTAKVTHPDGTTEVVTNLNAFCRKYGLHSSCVSNVMSGKRKHHKGFRFEEVDNDNR